MHTEKLRSDQSIETRDQLHGIGTRLVFYVLCLVIAFPPGALLPFAHAAFVDETASRMPPVEEDSYGFAVADVDSVKAILAMSRIATLDAKLRWTHVNAHLAQTAILTDEQRHAYVQLRGYLPGQDHSGAHDHGS